MDPIEKPPAKRSAPISRAAIMSNQLVQAPIEQEFGPSSNIVYVKKRTSPRQK